MEEARAFENFPLWMVISCGSASVAIVAIGAAILAGLTIWLAISYLVYWLWTEIRVLRRSCVDCAYYGKVCGFGKGKLCALLFKKGTPENFAEATVSWSDVLPDFLVFIFPIIGGIVSLVRNFSWPVVVLLGVLVLLASVGNGVVRGAFACKYCRQREIGCPASKLLAGKKEGGGS